MCQVSQPAGSGATGKRKRAGASGAGSSRGLPHEPSSLAAALSAQQRGHVQKIKQEKVEMQAQCEQTAALVAQRELEAREAQRQVEVVTGGFGFDAHQRMAETTRGSLAAQVAQECEQCVAGSGEAHESWCTSK